MPSDRRPSLPRRRAALLLAASAAGAMGLGALAARAAAPAGGPPPADWSIDRAASRVSLALGGEGAAAPNAMVQGVFKRWTASVAFDPAKPAKGKVEFAAETASLVTGDPARDQALTGAGALAAAKAPKLGFVSRTISPRADGGFDAAGTLSLRGAARPASAVLRFAHDPRGRRLDIELTLPPEAFATPGRPRPATAALAVRLAARDR